MKQAFQVLAIAVLACLSIGCGGTSDGFDYQAVSGTVQLDGQPLADATVAFVPQSTSLKAGRPSTGITDAEGKFALTALSGTNGAVVGEHLVTISTEKVDMTTQEVLAKETLPARYNRKTELRFEVPKNGTTEANFELTSGK